MFINTLIFLRFWVLRIGVLLVLAYGLVYLGTGILRGYSKEVLAAQPFLNQDLLLALKAEGVKELSYRPYSMSLSLTGTYPIKSFAFKGTWHTHPYAVIPGGFNEGYSIDLRDASPRVFMYYYVLEPSALRVLLDGVNKDLARVVRALKFQREASADPRVATEREQVLREIELQKRLAEETTQQGR